jgi:hypothetical protein
MDLINTDTYSRPVQLARSKSAAISNELAFSIGESALGKVLVARSAVGVCAILIGSDTDELSSDLATRFPDNRLVADEQQLRDDLSKVMRFIETNRAKGSTYRWTCGTARHFSAGCGRRSSCDPLRRQSDLRRTRPPHRHAERGPCGCQRLRSQRDRFGHPLPPGRPERRHSVGLSLGRGAQASADL